MIEAQDAAIALVQILERIANGEKLSQSSPADPVRRAAEADLSAQTTKTWPVTN